MTEATPPPHPGPAAAERTMAELADAAEIAWRNVLVAESQALQPDGCCAADVWRGHLCHYHQGFEDGIDAVLERLRAVGHMTSGR